MATYSFQNPCSWEINPGNSQASRSDSPSAGCWAVATTHPSLPGPPGTARQPQSPFPHTTDSHVRPGVGPLHWAHPDSSNAKAPSASPHGSFSLPALQRGSCPEPGDEPPCPSHGKRLQEPGARSASAAFPSARAGGARHTNISLQGPRLRCLTISCQLIQNSGLHAFACICMARLHTRRAKFHFESAP